jgi:predicted nucleic acid-binding Zn ribbon protein
VTDQVRIAWEIAGLDEGRPPATVGWRRPKRVRLEGEELVFEWPDDLVLHAHAQAAARLEPYPWWEWREHRGFLMTFGVADVYPSRAMLLRFAGLKDAPDEKIRAFAERFGALQEQIVRVPDWPAPPLLPDRQPVRYWRLISSHFSRALVLAAKARTPREENEITWQVNGHLWQAGIEDFLMFVDGQPRILHSAGGLYGGLAVELLSAVARVGLRLCVGCGAPIEKGGRRYCEECRASGVPERNRQTQWRRRQSRLKSEQETRLPS